VATPYASLLRTHTLPTPTTTVRSSSTHSYTKRACTCAHARCMHMLRTYEAASISIARRLEGPRRYDTPDRSAGSMLSMVLVCHHSASRCPLPRGPATRCSVTTPHLNRACTEERHASTPPRGGIVVVSSIITVVVSDGVGEVEQDADTPVPCGVSASLSSSSMDGWMLSDGPLGRKVRVCTQPHYRHKRETY